MASTCVNHIGLSSDSFLDRPSTTKLPAYAWLSPRKSLNKEYLRQKDSDVCNGKQLQEDKKVPEPAEEKSGEGDLKDENNEFGDFEFRLEDNFTMLPADELFFDGKLMPLQLSLPNPRSVNVVKSQHLPKLSRNEISMDPYLFSPKAPRCTTRWKELLGLRKLYQKEKEKEQKKCSSPLYATSNGTNKSFRNLLHRSSKSSMSSSSLNIPLLKDDNDIISASSSRLSLSSSSSGHEHEDLPRLSLDTDNKQNSHSLPRVSIGGGRRSTSSEVRGGRSAMRRQTETDAAAARGISMDSPRMNASGKIIFQSLERSSSSPSSYGGPRYKHSSVQRSYSANVRVTPVLNVPVCSKSGTVFGLFGSSSNHKRDSFGSISGSSSSKGAHHNQTTKHRKDRNSVQF